MLLNIMEKKILIFIVAFALANLINWPVKDFFNNLEMQHDPAINLYFRFKNSFFKLLLFASFAFILEFVFYKLIKKHPNWLFSKIVTTFVIWLVTYSFFVPFSFKSKFSYYPIYSELFSLVIVWLGIYFLLTVLKKGKLLQ